MAVSPKSKLWINLLRHWTCQLKVACLKTRVISKSLNKIPIFYMERPKRRVCVYSRDLQLELSMNKNWKMLRWMCTCRLFLTFVITSACLLLRAQFGLWMTLVLSNTHFWALVPSGIVCPNTAPATQGDMSSS